MTKNLWLALGLAGMTALAGCASKPAPMAAAPEPPAAMPQPAPDMPHRRPGEHRGNPIAAYDIDKDGTLDLAEVKSAAAAHFDDLNPDADDKLDRKEARRVLGGKTFAAADTDHDGTVDKAEYLAHVETLFTAADHDGDGTLDSKELRAKSGVALLKLLR